MLILQWTIGLIPHGGPIEIFPIPVSAAQKLCFVFSCLWDGAYKRCLAAN